MPETEPTAGVSRSYHPTPAEVDDLLRRAADHPRGTGFLIKGAPDAVAAIFGVHAFVVDAARDALRAEAETVAAGAGATRA